MALKLGTLEYLISVNSSEVQKGINSAESKVKNFGNRLSAWAVAKGQVLGRLVENAGKATVNFVKNSVSESMGFNKSMSQVAATLGKTTEEVQDLAQFARKMGSETAFTATEAAEALNYMALAGYDSEKSMRMLPQVLNLAAAGNMDLARASDIVTDAQSALGLSIEETEQLIDQMAKTSSKTNTNVEQLGDAILAVGGTAKQLKGGTTELNAVLGVLADNGIKGAEGGTALRNVLQRLTAPTSKATKELKKLGVEPFKDGNLKSLPEIFQEFNKALGDKTIEERAKILGEIFNVRDLKSVEALLGTTNDKWTELMLNIKAADGAAEQMAETQLDNLAGDTTKFKSALGEAKLAIVQGLEPQLRKLVQEGTKVVQRLTNAFKEGGLKGAIQEADTMFGEFIENLKNSDSPILQKVGQALEGIRTLAHHVYNLFTDFDAEISRLRESDSPVLHLIAEALSLVRDGFDGLIKLIQGDWIGAVRTFKDSDSEILKTVGVIADTFDQGRQRIVGFIDAAKEAFGVAGSGGKLYKSYAEKMSHSYNEVNDEESRKKWLSDLGTGLREAGFTSDQIGIIRKRFEGYGFSDEDKKGMQASLNQLAGVGSPYGVEQLLKEWDELNSREPSAFTAIAEQLALAEKRIENLKPFIEEEHPIAVEVEPKSDEEKLKEEQEKLQKFADENPVIFDLMVRQRKIDGAPPLDGFFHNAKGNWDVPYDNYPTLLHRGERVLTASQARHDDSGVNTSAIVEAIQSLKQDMANLKIVVGRKTFGRTVVSYGGERVEDYIMNADSKLASGYGT